MKFCCSAEHFGLLTNNEKTITKHPGMFLSSLRHANFEFIQNFFADLTNFLKIFKKLSTNLLISFRNPQFKHHFYQLDSTTQQNIQQSFLIPPKQCNRKQMKSGNAAKIRKSLRTD